jgi:hypothetical protein
MVVRWDDIYRNQQLFERFGGLGLPLLRLCRQILQFHFLLRGYFFRRRRLARWREGIGRLG